MGKNGMEQSVIVFLKMFKIIQMWVVKKYKKINLEKMLFKN